MDSYVEDTTSTTFNPPSSAEKIGEKSVNDDGKERSHTNEYAIDHTKEQHNNSNNNIIGIN
eukprot:scaffold14274_cov215-Skeletonema_marinoi.AAC.16